MVRPTVNHRELMALVCGVLCVCGVFAPWAGGRYTEARAVEAAVGQAVTLIQYLALRASTASGIPPPLLEHLRREPGMEALWMTDVQGAFLAQAGPVGATEAAVARQVIGATKLVAHEGARQTLHLRLRYTDGEGRVRGAVGCRFRPDRAAAALGAPRVLPWYWIGCAAVGAIVIGWALGRYRPNGSVRSHVDRSRPSHPYISAPAPHDLHWATAVADCFPQPVLILDAGQRIVAANTAATQRAWWPADAHGRHLLDLTERVPWGSLLVDLVDRVAQGAHATAHQEVAGIHGTISVAVARMEGAAAPIGWWLVLQEAEHDDHSH